MATFKVKVKWGKELFPDVDVDVSESPMVFKAQVFALTGVQPQRQKIMVKGATIKDDAWEGVKIKNGATILMMGSKEEDVPAEPAKQTTFIEDMTEDQLNTALDLPVGIKNLGNTCYLNAVVQCLKTVPELQDSIKEFESKSTSDDGSMGPILTTALQECYRTMDTGKTAIPIMLVNIFRTAFPSFAELGEQRSYTQQDASECWTELVRILQEQLPARAGDDAKTDVTSMIDQYFSGQLENEWTCLESEDEEKKVIIDKFSRLSFHISQEVKYLQSGLLALMKEQIEKRSEKLDRNAVFVKKTVITRLPAYLTVEMIRFFFKGNKAVNAKILKDVKFPIMLDVFDLCSKELQIQLTPTREKYKDMEDWKADEAAEKKRGKNVDKLKTKKFPYHFKGDLGSNNSGFYELQAVLTHQGRSSSSGHYVAWVRFRNNEWLKCDDDVITPVTEEEILLLSGGGDWHCAYRLLYGPRILELLDKDNEAIASSSKEPEKEIVGAEKMETD